MEHANVLKEIVDIITRDGGSDVHLSEDRYPTIRVIGDLVPLTSLSKLTRKDTIAFLNILLSDEMKDSFDDNMEVDFSYQHSKDVCC